MDANLPRRIVSLLIVLPMLLSAQLARQHHPVALKHWAAPLYWQPTQASAEERALGVAANATGLPASANPLVFVAMPPCRIVDTRAGQGFTGAFGPPSLVAGAIRTFPILSNTTCPIPAIAQAYSFEISVVPPGPLAYITAFPTGEPSPVAAIAVESPLGYLVSNTGIIPAGTNGSVDVYATNATDIVIDINGYYAAIGDINGNTTLGVGALQNNIGVDNTATGNDALQSNTTGRQNTASGANALQSNTTGAYNTASGNDALGNNTTGNNNTANGTAALQSNTTGAYNTANGQAALQSNTTGADNMANGMGALFSNTTGSNNTAIGNSAGANLTTGSGNIDIGFGASGNAGETATIRIGGPSYQTRAFIVGIRGITTGNNNAIPVVIDSNGQLGTVSSSRRFKEDIHDMDTASDGLLRLRPVTFRYQKPFADGSKPIQYGLIAEEVSEVYPDLVARSADGQIETVKYQVLDSMLLNELQKEHLQVQEQEQAEMIRLLQARLTALEETTRPGK
jgi:hypothetical protein